MNDIPRLYTDIVRRHLNRDRQMLFLSGPRQVGKTTLCESISKLYLNWDNATHRTILLAGEDRIADFAELDRARAEPPVLVLDELYHFDGWKRLLKGFFDVYGKRVRVIVTGSARLDVFKKGGDSLMGRYFPYRMHPLSVGELLRPVQPTSEVSPPSNPGKDVWDGLLRLGGFPEPFAKGDSAFLSRWHRLRFEQLVREDVRKDTAIRELDQMESLARILAARSGEQLVWSSLGAEVQVSEITAKAWTTILESFFFGFRVKPWARDIAGAIRKTPKWYLRDWSRIRDDGKRHETMLACHLLKAVQLWTDLGLGEFDLFYVRDKRGKTEVDFLVSKDGEPWLLVECKSGNTKVSASLREVQNATRAPHAFQVAFSLPYEDIDCFALDGPFAVPAQTLLSQLP
jgi:predicted AAA+ superfamily ATPase